MARLFISFAVKKRHELREEDKNAESDKLADIFSVYQKTNEYLKE